MGCCASLLGCYRVSDSVIVVLGRVGSDDAPPRPEDATASAASGFPPPHELYGIRPLPSEKVLLRVQNTPGKILKRQFRTATTYQHRASELAACSHILVTDQRLLVLFKPFYGGSANLIVRWDDPKVHHVRVSVEEGKGHRSESEDDEGASAPRADLLVIQWDHGDVMQLPSVSGEVEVRLRTPHATLIRGAIQKQRKEA